MSLTRLAIAVGAAILAYSVTAALARVWRRRGKRFTLRLGPEVASVVDDSGNELFRIPSMISYERKGETVELTAVGDETVRQGERTARLSELQEVPRRDAVELVAGFAHYCLVRARQEAHVPVWRYATLAFEVDKDLPLVEILADARRTKPLRNATREIVFVSSPKKDPTEVDVIGVR